MIMCRQHFYIFLVAIGTASGELRPTYKPNYGSYGQPQNYYEGGGGPQSEQFGTGFYPPTYSCGACPTGSYREANSPPEICGRCVISSNPGECHNYECSPQYPCPQRCRPRSPLLPPTTCCTTPTQPNPCPRPYCPPHPRIPCPYIAPVQCPTNIPCSEHIPRNCTPSSITLCPPLPSIHVPQLVCPPHPPIMCPPLGGHIDCPVLQCPSPQPIKCPQVQCPPNLPQIQCPIPQTPQCPRVICPSEFAVCPTGPNVTKPDCPTIKLPPIVCPTPGPVVCPPHPEVRCPRVSCPPVRVGGCQQWECPRVVEQEECVINNPVNCPSTCSTLCPTNCYQGG